MGRGGWSQAGSQPLDRCARAAFRCGPPFCQRCRSGGLGYHYRQGIRIRSTDPRTELSTPNPLVALLLRVMDQAYDQKSWHGTTRHNIWELTLHAAYWKYIVRRRLAGDSVGSFERKPSNWPDIPEPADSSAWKRDVSLLEGEH